MTYIHVINYTYGIPIAYQTDSSNITSKWLPSLPDEYRLPSLGLGRNLYLQYFIMIKQRYYNNILEDVSSFLTHSWYHQERSQ